MPLPSVDTSTPVLVLSAQNYGCLGIIRSLGRLGVAVHAVDADPPRPAAHSRYLAARHVFDLAAAHPRPRSTTCSPSVRGSADEPSSSPPGTRPRCWSPTSHDALGECFLFPRQPAGWPRPWPTRGRCTSSPANMGSRRRMSPFPTSIDDVTRFAADGRLPGHAEGHRWHSGSSSDRTQDGHRRRPDDSSAATRDGGPGPTEPDAAGVHPRRGTRCLDVQRLLRSSLGLPRGLHGSKAAPVARLHGRDEPRRLRAKRRRPRDHDQVDEGDRLPGHPGHRLSLRRP